MADDREAEDRRPSLDLDRWWILFLLFLVYTINIADRFVVSMLVEPIKAEFHLSDAAVGLLTGTALALFYCTAGIPVGVLADRVNRKRMVAASVALWSVLMIACGLTKNFWQLFMTRIGVGIGEAGGTPPSNSILTDKFPPRQRPFALTLYSVGASAGSALASSLGGFINDAYGWRRVLMAFGLVGVPIAILIMLTMREPVRGQLDAHMSPKQTLRESFAFISSQRSLVHVIAGSTVITFWGWGSIWWTPAFLGRSHHLSVGEVGAMLGAMHGIGGTAVTLGTAALLAWFAHRPARYQVKLIAWTTLFSLVPSIFVYVLPDIGQVKIMLWIFLPMTYLYIGPTFALAQNLVPPTMRSLVCALVVFTANIANLAIAPTLVGGLSDLLAPHLDHPQDSLRYILIGSAFTGLWGALHYFTAARTLPEDLVRAGSEAASV